MSSTGDGIEIRITGTLDPSVVASTSAAAAEIDKINQSAVAWGKALTANTGQATALVPAVANVGTAVAETSAHMGRNRAVTEGLVLVHEALQGRMSRMPGSAMIFAQYLTNGNTAMVGMGAAGLALVGVLGYVTYEIIESAKNIDRLTTAFSMTGRQSQVTSESVTGLLRLFNQMPGSTNEATQGFVHFLSTHAEVSYALGNQVGQLLPAFIKAYGKEAPEAAGKLAVALTELTSEGFQKLDREMLNLSVDQYENIQHLIETGDTAKAVSAILDELSKRTGTYRKSIGDQIYDDEQSIKDLHALLKNMPAGLDVTAVYQQLEDLEKDHADKVHQQTEQGKQEKDAAYKKELDAAQKVNDKLDERGKLLAEIARYTADAANAKPGDVKGKFEFTQAEANAERELTELDKKEEEKRTAEATRQAKERARIAEREENERVDAARNAETLIEEILRAGAKQDADIERDNLATALSIQKIDFEARKADLDRDLTEHRITAAKKLELAQQLAYDVAAAEAALLQKEIDSGHLSVEEKQRNVNRLEVIWAQYYADIAQMAKQAAVEQRREDQQAAQEAKRLADERARVESGLVNDILFTRGNLWQTLGQAAENYLKKEIVLFITHEEEKTAAAAAGDAATLATHEAAHAAGAAADAAAGGVSIMNDAYKAAAGAYAAVVGIPIVGPVLAPIAAGTAFAAVAAFDVLTSAEGGAYNTGAGGFYQLHPEESVIPAPIANPMRDFFEAGPQPQGEGGGDVLHAHFHMGLVDGAAGKRMIMDNADAIVAALKKKVRKGSREMRDLVQP